MASVLCDLDSDLTRKKEENKKRVEEAEKNRRRKSEDNQVMENKERLKGIESCEALVHCVLTFGMDHINNHKVKDIWVLLLYHFGLERLKWRPKKVELVEDVTDLFQGDWEVLMQRVGGGGLVVTNDMG